MGGDTIPKRDFKKYTSLILKNREKINLLLSSPYPFNEINRAIKDFSSGSIGRPIIKII